MPIYPIKAYSVTFSTQGWNRASRIPLLDDGRKISIVPLGDQPRVAGTAEFAGHPGRRPGAGRDPDPLP